MTDADLRAHFADYQAPAPAADRTENVSARGQNGRVDRIGKGNGMQEMRAVPNTRPELQLRPQPEEAWEWQAELGGCASGWRDLESPEHLVWIALSITHEEDWFTVQTKDLDNRPSGRFAQAANTGKGYLVEVAQVNGKTTLNWRIGLGPAADAAGNEPNAEPTGTQNLSLMAMIEVIFSWLQGKGVPLGYGASLCVYP